ncbi:glucose/galactose MFS transporter [Asaia bogorensis]|uniref:Glucose/galactose MFS transporter n=1 Tax=Asaia bogorensis NBRC 16594 TaxID=1231624 RepID=A0AAN4R006_9PROT|nr:glucose/galactose MFS transporter [Asaia bogorensis]BAT20372.1 glucose/galactose transporter [Asaia bogorensis NBRC 16594]GBQ79554.1 glucose/galactose transporter [Asaia bogorensis NBRC 16594]GEL52206.1 glucose/galactose MFS transporter [Asaia bogorensis NBRC 16594]
MSQLTSHDNRLVGPYGYSALAIAALIFFAMGFVTWLNGPLISFVRVAFSLSEFSSFFIPLAFYFSFFLFSIPTSLIAQRLGLKTGLTLSVLVSALGVAVFGQFVAWRIYPGALTGLLILGAGISLMQVVINPLVSLLGPADRAAQRISIMGICNKTAGILAPLVLGLLVMRNIGAVAEKAQSATDPVVREALLNNFVQALYLPYLGMAGILVIIAAIVAFAPLPNLEAPPIQTGDGASPSFFKPHLVFGFIAMFLYVGIEVMAGDAIGTYGQSFGLPLDETKFFTALTLTGMLVGYIMGFIIVPRFIRQEVYVQLSCLVGCVLTVLAVLTHGYTSVFCVALLGVTNAMIMPTLFPIAIRGAGHLTAMASAIMVMSYSGGAVVPQFYVWLKPVFGFQGMFAMIVIPAYLIILGYARRYGRVGLSQGE